MIGKAKSCIGGYSLFHYVIDPSKGYELERNNLCGETPLEIMQEMKILQDFNQRATNKLISMVLSPHIEDGEKLTKKQLRELLKQFFDEMNIDAHAGQFLAFVHTEKRHRHIHILLNRVKEDATIIPDHHIGKRAQWAAHHVAEKNGLISAKQMRIDKIRSSEKIHYGSQKIRKDIYRKHLLVIAKNPETMEKYLSEMRKLGFVFLPSINKQGQLQGYRIRDMETQIEMKASDVHRKMSLKGLLDAGLHFENSNHPSTTMSNEKENKNIFHSSENHLNEQKNKEKESVIDVLFQPSYSPAEPENDLFKKRRKKRR